MPTEAQTIAAGEPASLLAWALSGGIMLTAMSPHVSIDRDVLAAFCQRHHIKRLALFGSVLHDDFRPDSDIDVLVEFEPGHVPSLALIRMQDELSEILGGYPIDLVTPKFLNHRIRAQVLSDSELIYAG